MSYMRQSLDEFIDAVSSDNPAPGGGSVSAYTALLGIALLKKTLVFSLKTDDVRKKQEIEDLLGQIDIVSGALMGKVDEDAKAFLECINAPKGPKRFEKARLVAEGIYKLCQKALKLHAKGSYLYRKSLKNDYDGAQRLIEVAFKISWENAQYEN